MIYNNATSCWSVVCCPASPERLFLHFFSVYVRVHLVGFSPRDCLFAVPECREFTVSDIYSGLVKNFYGNLFTLFFENLCRNAEKIDMCRSIEN